MDAGKVRGMVGFGGVRIEDDIIITADGIELMTCVPRTVKVRHSHGLHKKTQLCIYIYIYI